MLTSTAPRPTTDWDSADIMAHYFEVEAKPWKERILNSLLDAAAMLDRLETYGASQRQLLTQSDGTYLIKWRD